MPFGAGAVNSFGGAVEDLLAGQATAKGQRITAGGMDIQADAMDITAAGMRLNAKGFLVKAAGDDAEAERYGSAADLSLLNEQFTEQSTALSQVATDRAMYKVGGTQRAQITGSGFTLGGSALDVMRDSAFQGAMTKAVAGQQGLITEAGYKQEAENYTIMRKAAIADAAAQRGFSVDQEDIAKMQDKQGVAMRGLADQQRDLADLTERNSKITAGIKVVSGMTSLFM